MYIDTFLLPVKTAEKDRYLALAKRVSELMVENGALRVIEAWGDDIPDGELTSYARALNLEPDESVVVALNLFPDRAARDATMTALRDNTEIGELLADAPADGPRIILGGFGVISDVSA